MDLVIDIVRDSDSGKSKHFEALTFHARMLIGRGQVRMHNLPQVIHL
jgi:hypothetical protein